MLSLVIGLAACSAEGPLDTNASDDSTGARDGGNDARKGDAGVEHDAGAEIARSASLEAGSPAPTDESALQQVAAGLDIQFTECTLFTGADAESTDDATSPDAGADPLAPAAECARVDLPLRWSDPDGESIEMFVKRVPAAQPARGQLWLLQGGPGSSGASLEWLAGDLHAAVPDLDIYIPDHRGVGRSTFFECKTALSVFTPGEIQMAECGLEIVRTWDDASREFSTTAAARDVLAAAMSLYVPGSEVIVWGGSYGALWTHRVLQVDHAARLVTAALMDSPALPIGGKSTLAHAHNALEAGQTLFGQCALDAACSERLGPNPEERALSILDNLCNEISQRGGRAALQALLTEALRSWRLLRLIPAALYRAGRCEPADVEFLDAYVAQIPDGLRRSIPAAPNSEALFLNVMFSEYLTERSSRPEIQKHSEGVVFSFAPWQPDYRTALADWPLYEADEYMGRWADSDIPVLTLYGAFDTNTAPSEGVVTAEQFSASGQRGYLLPTGGHGVYYRSHDLKDDPHTSCGKHLTVQFLRNPERPVDGSCVDAVDPLDFSASEELLLEIAGHTDVWDNP